MYILYRAITQTPILSNQKNSTGCCSITPEALKISCQKSLAGIGKWGLISISPRLPFSLSENLKFIDVSREFEDGKKQNRLRDEDIEKIVSTFREFAECEKYSHLATLEEIHEAEFNLNIPRYVDTFEEEEDIDIPAVQEEIQEIEAELVKTQKELNQYLRELKMEN